jgi:GDPmannose 4,6-dehydratase
MKNKTALVCGVTGQDGAYLANLLLSKSYRVIGASRDAQQSSFENFSRLNIGNRVERVSMSIIDFRSVLQLLIKYEPDEVYNLAGQSSVGLSFEQPVETLESIVFGTHNLLECIRFYNKNIRFYNACSSECFGDTGIVAANESTPFCPRSPYAVAKAAAFWGVANYRDSYGIFACSGILSNHESPLRHFRFVTQKIISSAASISRGSDTRLTLGNLSIQRDWGWAGEYVEAMWRMLQQDEPSDYVIATGQTNSLKDFVAAAFSEFGLNWEEYVDVDKGLFRPSEINCSRLDPSKAALELNWSAKSFMNDVVHGMAESFKY